MSATIEDIIASLAAITGDSAAPLVADALAIIDARLSALEPCTVAERDHMPHVWADGQRCARCNTPGSHLAKLSEYAIPTVSARESALDDALARGRAMLDAPSADRDAQAYADVVAYVAVTYARTLAASGSVTRAEVAAQEASRASMGDFTPESHDAFDAFVAVVLRRNERERRADETDACMACVVAASTEGEGIGGALRRIRERLPRRFGDDR